MVKFNFWELAGFYGKHPKRFKKDSRKQIEKNTLDYLKQFGRGKWVSVVDIFKDTLEKTNLFNSSEGKMWFAEQGIKSKINLATHKLRRDGHPIISGRGHKGYRYADEDCKDFIDRWNEKFNAWDRRGTNLITERKIDIYLIEKVIKRLLEKGRKEEAKQLQEVIVKYRNKNIEKEGEE